MKVAPKPLIGVTYASNELDGFPSWRLMFRGVDRAGGVPLAIDCGEGAENVGALVARLDALILSGGVDVHPELYGGDLADPTLYGVNPRRDFAEMAAFRTARHEGIPVLAVCRGMHLLNAMLGGTLWADLRRDRPSSVEHRRPVAEVTRTAHDIAPTMGTLLSSWTGTDSAISVNSRHHQGVRQLAPGFVASAHAPDGLVEAIELSSERILGIQWHPEVLWQSEAHALRLLESFVAVASGVRLLPDNGRRPGKMVCHEAVRRDP